MRLPAVHAAPRGGQRHDGGDERRDLLVGGVAADNAQERGLC
jgi:hypothetical protein